MKSIAIITARGGSKRIPRKNIKDFCGKPIIAYSIEAALKSNVFDTVMVSTDDEEIAEIAKRYGAEVPFMRSEETSNDFATTSAVCLEVLEQYKRTGFEFDIMSCIYPTAPFVTAKKLKDAHNRMIENNCNEIVPVVRFSFPPQRAYVIKDGQLEFKWEKYSAMRSQDLEPFYHDAGQFYFYSVAEYLRTAGKIKNDILPLVLPETEVQDIDNIDDWHIAEVKYLYLLKKKEE